MRIRASGYTLALIVAAGACGSEETFEPQLGSNERLLDTTSVARFGSDNEGFDQVTVVGDLDGDGIDDAVIRTGYVYLLPSNLYQGGGSTYILYGGKSVAGNSDVRTLPHLTGAYGGDGFLSVAAVGDVDGDGLADMLVTAERSMLCAGNIDGAGDDLRTGAYLVYGSRTRVTGEVAIASVSTFLRDTHPCTMITTVAGLGDLDGDGKPDFTVARAGIHVGEPTEALMFYGRDTRLPAVVDLVEAADARIGGWPADPGTFVTEIAGVGDVDGDGYSDFMLQDAVPSANSLRLIRGSATRLAGSLRADALSQTVFLGADPCHHEGVVAARLGDLDGDGADDFALVGCHGADYRVPQTVADLVFYGRRAGFPAQVRYDEADATLPLGATAYSGGFGHLVAGDLDGDGFLDLVMGDSGSHDENGGVHVMKGNGTRLHGLVEPAARGLTYVGSPRRAVSCDFARPDCIVHEHAGYDVSLGDLTGDHRLDLFVEAAGSFGLSSRDLYGSAMDRAYVLSPEGTNR